MTQPGYRRKRAYDEDEEHCGIDLAWLRLLKRVTENNVRGREKLRINLPGNVGQLYNPVTNTNFAADV